MVLDASTLAESQFHFNPPSVYITQEQRTFQVEPGTPGWIRRLSPMDWEAGVTIGSHDAVTKASWLALLASLLRHPDIQWLSPIDATIAAENKLTQYTTATRLGIAVPETHVTNMENAPCLEGGEFIAKPLGPGHFRDEDGNWLSVFTETFDPNCDDDLALLAGPPFLVQRRIRPSSHLRVTTVGDRAWVFRLPAEGLPIDWRQSVQAHHDWTPITDDGISALAIRLARAHGLNYSSQDWLEVKGSLVFLDLNPSGQWLFLPAPESDEITREVARWLSQTWD